MTYSGSSFSAIHRPLKKTARSERHSMFSRILRPLLTLALAAGMGITSLDNARAEHGAGIAAGVAAGIIGLGILGATAGARRDYYYDAYDAPSACYRGPRTWFRRAPLSDPQAP
jgi:hypothetical protein